MLYITFWHLIILVERKELCRGAPRILFLPNIDTLSNTVRGLMRWLCDQRACFDRILRPQRKKKASKRRITRLIWLVRKKSIEGGSKFHKSVARKRKRRNSIESSTSRGWYPILWILLSDWYSSLFLALDVDPFAPRLDFSFSFLEKFQDRDTIPHPWALIFFYEGDYTPFALLHA